MPAEKYWEKIKSELMDGTAAEIESEDLRKKEFEFENDIIKDRFENNDDRLGFQRMDFSLQMKVHLVCLTKGR